MLWPIGIIWMGLELVAGGGLLAASMPRLRRQRWTQAAAVGVMIVAVAYAALAVQASIRGLQPANCTCFGVFLGQPLSGWVLVQDGLMLLWSGWELHGACAFTRAAPAAERRHGDDG